MDVLSRTRFLDKSLLAIAHAAEQFLFSEAYARKPGFLQSLDVRVKLLTFLFLIILVSLLHNAVTLWALYAVCLLLAIMSGVPIGFFQKRVWLFVPLFSAAVVLPALFNIVTPGDPLVVLLRLERSYVWGPYTIPSEITVTRQGVGGAIIFLSRVATSVSFAVLFAMTTRWNVAFSGLRSLLVPRVFVVTLSMTERYIFVFLRLIQDMYRARKSRTIRTLPPAIERNWTASRIGVTFKKSIDMSEDIYKAMLARGFHGEFLTLDRFHVSQEDVLWLAVVLMIGTMLILFEKGILMP